MNIMLLFFLFLFLHIQGRSLTFSDGQKLLRLLFGRHCLREVFQTLHDYNLAWGLAVHTKLMTLTLFQGHRFV